jgi:hypothetical protein
MEIEIITTKKKLSKSLVNQMLWLTINDVHITEKYDYNYVLGFYVDKGLKIAIVKVIDEYKRITLYNWHISKTSTDFNLYCQGNRVIRFDDSITRDSYFEKYTKLKEVAEKTHIYI